MSAIVAPSVPRLKVVQLMVAKRFMKPHPRAGEPTFFRDKIESGEKIHTIRGNYAYWSTKLDQVRAGTARLALKEWTNRPRRDPAREFLSLTKNVGYQSIDIGGAHVFIDGFRVPEFLIATLAKNDGLSLPDFRAWFARPLIGGILIHATEHRYNF